MENSARRLLIVEDEPALATLHVDAFESLGYHVDHVDNREAALAYLASDNAPGIVLLDLGLPPAESTMIEGLALLDQWLQIKPGTKIIVLTGQDEQVAALEAIRRGAFDFLVKPASMASVTHAVKRAELFRAEESRMSSAGETRLHLTARLDEGPKEAASAAEEQLLRRTYTDTGHNASETARRLGLPRELLYYYLKKYGIRRPD